MTTLFNRWLPGFTLLVWSTVLLTFYVTGKINSLIIPVFRTNAVIAGCVMLLMAGCFLFLPGVAKCCDDDRCGHPLGRRKMGRLLTFAVLILPVAVAAMVSPKDFGVDVARLRGLNMDGQGLVPRKAVARVSSGQQTASADNPTEPALPQKDGSQPAAQTASTAPASTDDYLPRAKDGNIVVQVIDLLYAAQDSSMQTDFQGKTVEIIGQLMLDNSNNAGGNRFKLMRMFMWCCAADAKPIAVTIEEPPNAPALPPEMSWVKVVGKVDFPIEGGKTIPILRSTSLAVTQPPEETMLY